MNTAASSTIASYAEATGASGDGASGSGTLVDLRTGDGVAGSPRGRTALLCLLLMAAVLLAYLPVLHNGFLNYDDDAYITHNPHVKAGLTWATVKWAFTTYDEANWAPLSWLSHALDCELFGLNPGIHHLVSVLLHAINAVLLFLLLRAATGCRWRSLMVAALFALHPINVESVAWAAERKNVLSMMFFLLALHAYIRYAQKPGVVRYMAVFFLFALGLLSKSQIITLPCLLLLWDYWPLGRMFPATQSGMMLPERRGHWLGGGRLVGEKVPLLSLSAASAWVTMQAEKAGGAVKGASEYSLLLRVETAVVSYVRYLGKAFWPTRLVALYPHPTALYPIWQAASAAMLLLLLTVFAVAARKRRYLAVGWLWFLGSMVPMIGLIQVGGHSIADRFAYLPFIGLFLIMTWGMADFVQSRHLRKAWAALPAVAVLLALATLTYRQAGYWHDPESFWTRTLALTKNNYVAQDSLGEYLADHGRIEEAAAHFRAALAIRPNDLPANLDLGAYEHSRGNFRAAVDRYGMVARYAGDTGLRARAYANLGSAYRSLGDLTRAKECFEQSLELQPDRPMPLSLIGLGLIAEKDGKFEEAVQNYSRAMKVEPTDVGYLLMAQALEEEGKKEEAEKIRAWVARVSPDLAGAERQVEALRGK